MTAGVMTRQACALVEAAGLALAPLLAKAGLTTAQIEDRECRFRAQSQVKFLQLAADALGDDWLGFHLGLTSELRDAGLLYYVLASSNLLGESLQRAERYSALNNEGIALRIRGERATAMAFHYVGIERQSDRHQIEYLLTAVIRICRQLTNRDLRPHRVRMVHRRREGSPELNAFLGCEVAFGSDADEIVFSENVAELPVVSGDPHLDRPAAAARKGASGRGCHPARHEPAYARPAAGVGGPHLRERFGGLAGRPRQASIAGRQLGHFPDRVATRVSRGQRVYPRFQTVDRQDAARGSHRRVMRDISAANPKFALQLRRVRLRTSGSKRH
jgi:hypothetical protein